MAEHEHRRFIPTDIWKDSRFAEYLNTRQRLLFLASISLADHTGKVPEPKELRDKVFTRRENVREGRIREDILYMVQIGLLELRELEPYIKDWHRYYLNLDGLSNWLRIKCEVFKRDNYSCVYCGGPAQHIDHVIPKCQGGGDDLDNLVAACISCNCGKGGRTPEEAGMEFLDV